MGKEETLRLARQTAEAQAFFNLAEKRGKGCLDARVMRPCDTDWVTCIDDAWVVRFSVSETCLSSSNEQLSLTLLINSKTGDILSRYPELPYFEDPSYCLIDADCRLGAGPAQFTECKNFIHALLENPDSPNDAECVCLESRCMKSPEKAHN